MKTKIKMQGIGTGKGEILEVLSEEVLKNKILEASPVFIYKKAQEKTNPLEDGLCFISIETGKIYSYSQQYNTQNQATDNQEVLLCKIKAGTEYIPCDRDFFENNKLEMNKILPYDFDDNHGIHDYIEEFKNNFPNQYQKMAWDYIDANIDYEAQNFELDLDSINEQIENLYSEKILL